MGLVLELRLVRRLRAAVDLPLCSWTALAPLGGRRRGRRGRERRGPGCPRAPRPRPLAGDQPCARERPWPAGDPGMRARRAPPPSTGTGGRRRRRCGSGLALSCRSPSRLRGDPGSTPAAGLAVNRGPRGPTARAGVPRWAYGERRTGGFRGMGHPRVPAAERLRVSGRAAHASPPTSCVAGSVT